jgi:hypothetical protein
MTENLNLITNEEVDAAAVSSAPNILGGTPEENKSVFDKLCKEVVIPKVNLLITGHMDINAKVEANSNQVMKNRDEMQELSQSIGNAEDLLRKNQGVDNAGKILTVGADGNVALSDPFDYGDVDTSTLLYKNQGIDNVGKILVVGADGNLTLSDMPSGNSGDIAGTVGDNNAITLTGDLEDGTYVLRYENTDGSYTHIGTLVVGGIVQYSISTALDNCVPSSDNPKIINEGETLTLTFVADNGFAFADTVNVTGATYSWDSENGILALSNPTEDVAISITAIKSGHTNIINPEKCSDNSRLSVSSGEVKALEGYVVSPMLYTGDYTNPVTFRTRGVDFSQSNSNIVLYNEDTEAFISGNALSNFVGTEWNGWSYTLDGNGNLTLVFNSSGRYKFKIGGKGSSENFVMTANEEIKE